MTLTYMHISALWPYSCPLFKLLFPFILTVSTFGLHYFFPVLFISMLSFYNFSHSLFSKIRS
jgi:hypothetical protein